MKKRKANKERDQTKRKMKERKVTVTRGMGSTEPGMIDSDLGRGGGAGRGGLYGVDRRRLKNVQFAENRVRRPKI